MRRLRWLLSFLSLKAVDEDWVKMDAVADRFMLPRQWLVCEHCGAHGWRLPPHGAEPCPLMTRLSEIHGMKLEAERTTAIRTAVQMENFMKMAQAQMEDDDDEE